QRRTAHHRADRPCLRAALRGRRPAQLRRRLRPHPYGLAPALRGCLAPVRRATGGAFPAHVALLPTLVCRGFPRTRSAAVAMGALTPRPPGRLCPRVPPPQLSRPGPDGAAHLRVFTLVVSFGIP